MKRLVSHSEITTALDCQARWDFSYGGYLVGDALKPKLAAPRLREGRAWGRAAAALYSADPVLPLITRYTHGLRALEESMEQEADELRGHGLYSEADRADMQQRIAEMLWHQAQIAEPLHVTDMELELRVPIQSRHSRRASTRFLFHGFLDGLAAIDGRTWIVELKLRGQLTALEQIVRGRQYLRYAWAAEQQLDQQIAGVIVDERLNELPKPARWVKGKKKTDPPLVPSHAKDQLTTRALYEAACAEGGVPVDEETAVALGQRRWQQRSPVLFRRSEIEEAGRELVSAAQLIAQLDTGVLFPVRNPSPMRCGMCAFREICPRPDDGALVDLQFERVPAKRMREEEALAA